jgi:hypothetical protein
VRRRILVFAAIAQSLLFLAHLFIYETWTSFWGPGTLKLQIMVGLLSVSFISTSILGFRYAHRVVRLLYTISVVWVGLLSFFMLAAGLCWVVYGAVRLFGLPWQPRTIAVVLFGLAIVASLYGMVNAACTRVKRITIKLPNLPESWRGRTAALVSDTHLGHVRNYGFIRRIIAMLTQLRPDVVFISGDLYDGMAADLDRLAEPWATLAAPFGAYFVAGNHDGFTGHAKHVEAVEQSGIHVLNNEKVNLDGLQIVGMHYRDSTNAGRFRSILQQAALDRDRPSILLTHMPSGLDIAEEEGISLQLSGHTHGGQLFPYTWVASRVWGQFNYGLKRLGNLLVYTSSGTGTWGPPMRVGTNPEIVLIQFE